MKVLFIARRYPPSVGGMERFAFDLSNALNKIVTMKKITWGGSNKWLPFVLPIFFVRAFLYLLLNPDVKIIHIQDGVQAPMGWLLHIIFRKPYIVVAHGLDITYNKAHYQNIILPFVRRADKIISISSATNDEVLSRGVDRSKTQVVTLGVHDDYGTVKPDREKLSTSIGIDLSDRKLLLTTGRMVKRKGVEWFIRNALVGIVASESKVLYLVVGDGVEKESIRLATQEANLADHVAMLGRVSHEVRSLLYQSVDIFVMPNIRVSGDMEGFGIVAQEAATAQLPVVASGIEGIADALHHHKNGILIDSGNADQFKQEILLLLSDANKSRAFGARAREYTLREYSWERIASKYADVYGSLAKQRL
jgi:glycosyltransferase involved in cell wall biosynthesis